MRCFRCAAAIVVLPEGDPRRESEEWTYFPAAVVEVLERGGPCFCTVICWTCMHELQPDQWMDRASWQATRPAVPFDALPRHDHTSPARNRIETYAAFAPPAPVV